VKEVVDFLDLPYWKDLDICHSIDVMYIEKNVCESLIRTLLNTNEKTRGHGHARADLKKMGIRLELCLDDSAKGTELPTSCITPFKTREERVLWVHEKCESSIRLLDECSKAYFIDRSKSSSRHEVSMIVIEI
jgi:hypothetical protein